MSRVYRLKKMKVGLQRERVPGSLLKIDANFNQVTSWDIGVTEHVTVYVTPRLA